MSRSLMIPLVLAVALAQTFDVSGGVLPPDGASARDPLLGFGGRPVLGGAASVHLEGAYSLLVREVRDGPFVRTEPVVDNLLGAQLAGAVPLSKRIGIAATLPLWSVSGETSGTGLGDLRVWTPIALRVRKTGGLLVVPHARLPTGSDKLLLGEPFAVGASVSAGLRSGPLSVSSDLGLEVGPGTGSDDWAGGVTGLFAGAAGLASDTLGIHAELRGRAPLGSSVLSIPSEALLTAKGRPIDRLWLSLGIGSALTRGPGAAAPRFFVGGTWSFTREEEEATGPLVMRETKELYVVDARQFPIADVQVFVGNDIVATGDEGFADVPQKVFQRQPVLRLEHPAYQTVERADLDLAASWWQIELQRKPVPVAVSVVGPEGEPMITGSVELRSTAEPALTAPDPRIDALGIHHWTLDPGTNWVAVMSGDRMGGQARVIDLPEERVEPIRIDVVLAWAVDPTTNLRVTVVDGTGAPVEDAAVAIENRDFGTTGPGGILEINGLPRGEHALTVRSAVYGEASVADVQIADDTKTTVTLDWPAGAVVARVEDANGQPLDATVRFAGPAALPPRTIGSDGVELFVLRPGEWTLSVDKEGLAAQERRVSVDDRPGVLREVVVTLSEAPKGEADVVVRVVDAKGDAVAGVEIAVDGETVGTTGADGSIALLDRAVGEATITADGELLVSGSQTVGLVDGRQIVEVPVTYVPGVVDLRAEEAGAPVDVTITATGDRPAPPVQTGLDGRERVVLTPGTWDLQMEMPDGRTHTRQVTVTTDSAPQEVLFQVLGGEETVEVEIQDAKGAPVADAVVRLGDVEVGRTDARGLVAIEGAPEGPLALQVEAEGFEQTAVTVEPKRDPADASTAEKTPVIVALARAPVDVPIVVNGPDGPVVAEVIVRTTEGASSPSSAATQPPTVRATDAEQHVFVTAPGLVAKQVVVPAEASAEPIVVTLDRPDKAQAQPLFAVEDRDGSPIADAPVFVNDEQVGTTSSSGTIALPAVAPNAIVRVVPNSPLLAPVEIEAGNAAGVVLVSEDAPRQVEVSVVAASDAPTGSPAGTNSPTPRSPLGGVRVVVTGTDQTIETTTDEVSTLALPPGTWSITAEADGQVAAVVVTVGRDEPPPPVQLVLQTLQARVEDGHLALPRPLLFDLDAAAIRTDASTLLDDVAALLRSNRRLALVEVAGHTDDQGGVVYNQALSERRAEQVRRALIERGVEPERLLRRGYGLSRPAAAGDEGRELNRRVEFVVLQTTD